MNKLTIIQKEKEKANKIKEVTNLYNDRVKLVQNDISECHERLNQKERKIISDFRYDMLEDIKDINQNYYSDCNHNIIIKSNDSMLSTGLGRPIPNPNHISYYCAICKKSVNKDEITDDAIIIDFFGHKDALKVGYDHIKALVDYSNQIALELLEFDSTFIDAEIAECIENGFLDVPEEYIRTK